MTSKFWTLFLTVLLVSGTTHAKVRIVASTTDLSSIAEMVGGDQVDVVSIANGKSDPHYVEVLPSYMIKVKRADIYLKVGLDLDRWADQIIDGSRNSKLVVVDCSERIAPLNVPTGKVDASMGDVHPRGNPHYWLDPDNGLLIAEAILGALSRVDADHAADYQAGFESFRNRLAAKREKWQTDAADLRGMEIVSYHDTWPYFERAFGVKVVGFVEPKPGIEPTPSHTASVVELIKSRHIKLIVVEPYFSKRTPAVISRATGATIVDLPPSVGGTGKDHDYLEFFDHLIEAIHKAKE